MFYRLTIIASLLFCIYTTNAQQKNRKRINAVRIQKPPKIDGLLNDDAWKNAEIAKDFVIFRPDNGKPASKDYATEVKLVYDDDAIYIAAKMLDPEPKLIPQEFSTRDNPSQADFFLVTINPNDDGQNPFQFIVQATGNQGDAKVSNGNEDFNWSAVWDSSAKITAYGWNVEMRIPYRALRFENRPVQSWGFNFHRRLERKNEQHTWTFINNEIGLWTQYDGLVENLKDIKPPTRLNLYPYASVITDTFDGHTVADWSAGMDVKYGLTENFTLDATLIPDFSQVGFDNVVLNLGPFEQQFAEQRQFFTEGTELFNKGGLFYSRRIGGRPIKSAKAKTNEVLVDEPQKVTMLNAIKVSGRTKEGLGVGFFNAITKQTEATIKDTVTGEIRKEITNPFSNYNIAVLDYQFNQNSSVTLINTNVLRDGNFRDANVTGLSWHLEDKKSTYNIDGSFAMSNISDDESSPNTGYTFDNSIGKQSGNWRWEVGYQFDNKDFDTNDMGILFSNNEQRIYSSLGYRLLKPKGIFNNYGININSNWNFLHKSGIFTNYNGGVSFWSQLKIRFGMGFNINYGSNRKDFFEPREGTLSGIFFRQPQRLNFNHWGSSNYQKKFAVDYNFYFTHFENQKESYGFGFSPRYRFSNKFSIQYNLNYNKTNNDQGYVDKVGNDIIFGQRGRKNITNTISGKYSFNVASSLSLSFRHLWASAKYNDYLSLNTDGSLSPVNYNGTDVNFNSWNLDLNYIWQINSGSQLIAFYRNAIFSSNENAELSFFTNLENLFNEPNQHLFSVRFVYFIDYNNLKKLF